MDSNTDDLLTYVALVVVASVVAHLCIRRFWIACAVITIGYSVLNLAHEIVMHDFHIRPSDVAFWLPMIFVFGAAYALPVALLVGLPFHFCRRMRKRI